MKKLFFVLIAVLVAASLWAEDLGELAKKEKARREALAREGRKGKVLTNKDVKDIKSSLGIESHTPVVEEPAMKETGDEPASALTQAEAVDQSNAQLEELKRQKAELTREIQEASDAIQQSGARSRNTGEQYREKRLKEEELKKVEEQIEELEKSQKEKPEEPEN